MSLACSAALSRSTASICGSKRASLSPCWDHPVAERPRRCAWSPGSKIHGWADLDRIAGGQRPGPEDSICPRSPATRNGVSILRDLASYDRIRQCGLSAAGAAKARYRNPPAGREGARARRDGRAMRSVRRRPCQVASSSVWQSRARWCSSRRCCCSTSRSAISTRDCARKWAMNSALQKRLGITTLYVTHDQDEAMAFSDRVVVMRAGKILQVGPPQDIYQRPTPSHRKLLWRAEPSGRDRDHGGGGGDLSKLGVRGESWQGIAYGNQKFAPGDKVRILVRPEDIWPEEMQNEVDAAWSGEVLELVFRGARRTLRVRTGRESCGSRFRRSLIPRLEQPSKSALQGLRFGPSPVPKGRRFRLRLQRICTYCCNSSVGRDQQPGKVP